ncbi:hypothetical protein [Cerasicoccus frondis]|uniref:hypothetical protein n=1 Tax=Cerasicoccus frondis TaxID=490090 RepID=UPI00285298AB|nr:hypothetical protein [Cerasicoccus frondis]
MPKINWSRVSHNTHTDDGRVVVVPRTPDFDRPFAGRVPTPPPRTKSQHTPRVSPPAPAPKPQSRSNPILLGICIAVGSIITVSGAAYWVMSQDYKPSLQERQMVSANLAEAHLAAQETAQDFVNSLQVSTVRLAGDQTRASLNGTLYRVGDLVDEHHGLVFVGADPDGEFLLFRDSEQQTHFYPLYKN